jgi:hypothetical protein
MIIGDGIAPATTQRRVYSMDVRERYSWDLSDHLVVRGVLSIPASDGAKVWIEGDR